MGQPLRGTFYEHYYTYAMFNHAMGQAWHCKKWAMTLLLGEQSFSKKNPQFSAYFHKILITSLRVFDKEIVSVVFDWEQNSTDSRIMKLLAEPMSKQNHEKVGAVCLCFSYKLYFRFYCRCYWQSIIFVLKSWSILLTIQKIL